MTIWWMRSMVFIRMIHNPLLMVTRRDTRCSEKQAPRTATFRCGGSLSSLPAIRRLKERERAKLAREIAENLQAELDIREWAIGLKTHGDFGLD